MSGNKPLEEINEKKRQVEPGTFALGEKTLCINADEVFNRITSGGKPPFVFVNGECYFKVPKRASKALELTTFEIAYDMSVYPLVTTKEALAFLRVQIKRCNMNLANAKDRGDKRAIVNLERKLAVYEYLQRVVEVQVAEDCPNCLVHAVGSNGVCPVCGWKGGDCK